MTENNTFTRVKILEDGTPARIENKLKKSSYIKKNKIKKYISKIDGKYVYPYTYTPIKKGPYFSSGKPKKMYLKNGKYIYINPPKPLEFFGPPPPPVLLPWHIQNLQPPKPLEFFGPPIYGQRGLIPYGYYYRNAEKVKQRMKDIRLAFNQTLPPLNLICEYCNKPFVLPGMNEKGHKQHEIMYCSGVCGDRAGRLRKLWIPKWLFNYYLDKKLFRIKVGFKLRTRWTLKFLLKSDKKKKFLRKYWWWNEDNRKGDEYNVIKKYYTYCMAFILLKRFKFCNECFKPFMFISTTRTKVYNYKSMIAQRIRKYKNMELYGKNLVPKEEHGQRGRRVHCSPKCANKRTERIRLKREEYSLRVWGTFEKPDDKTIELIKERKRKEYYQKRKKEDPAFYFICVQRTRIHKLLKRNKYYLSPKDTKFTMELLGIKTREEFLEHIQKHLLEGMTWENYGSGKDKWVLDHTIPIKYFKNNFDLLNDFDIQRECFGIHNLKPMWWLDNAHKAAKLDYNGNK